MRLTSPFRFALITSWSLYKAHFDVLLWKWRKSNYLYHYNKDWCKRIKRTNNDKNRASDIHK